MSLMNDTDVSKEHIAFKKAIAKFSVETEKLTEYGREYAKPRGSIDSNTTGFFKWFKNYKSQWIPYSGNTTKLEFNNNIRHVPLNQEVSLKNDSDSSELTDKQTVSSCESLIRGLSTENFLASKDLPVLEQTSHTSIRRSLSDSIVFTLKYDYNYFPKKKNSLESYSDFDETDQEESEGTHYCLLEIPAESETFGGLCDRLFLDLQ